MLYVVDGVYTLLLGKTPPSHYVSYIYEMVDNVIINENATTPILNYVEQKYHSYQHPHMREFT